MLTLIILIQKLIAVPEGRTLGYYVLFEVSGVQGVGSDVGPLNTTQEQALTTLEQKLRLSHNVGSLISYEGRLYSAVEPAVEAVRQSAPRWK